MARILIVEDVRFIANVLASYFEDRGHQVILAGDGQQALDEARADPPELILTDISMPNVDGLEFARRLKSDPATAVAPILILTARSDEAAMKAAVAAGVDEYMLKPFDTQQLLRKATALLGGFPMNFALNVYGDLPVLSALTAEWGLEAADHVRSALGATYRHCGRTPVLDLSRIEKVETPSLDRTEEALVDFAADGKISAVAPKGGMGIRALREKLDAHVRWHADLGSAMAAHGAKPDVEPKPIRLGVPSRTAA